MVTKNVDPFRKAVWTLTAAHGAVEEYLFEIRDTRPHPSLGLSARDYETMRMNETGLREHILVKFDQNLLLMTSPHTAREFHVIDRQRGVWADNAYCWHDDFKTAKKREKAEVRVEPWNANVIYVYFRNHWIAAIVRDLSASGGRTRREMEIALRTERRIAKVNSNRNRLGKANAKKMIGLWSPEKFDERIGKQQREMTYLYSRLEMTVALPVNVPIMPNIGVEPEASTSLMEATTSVKAANVASPADMNKSVETDADESSIWGGNNEYV
jgi:putative transposase